MSNFGRQSDSLYDVASQMREEAERLRGRGDHDEANRLELRAVLFFAEEADCTYMRFDRQEGRP